MPLLLRKALLLCALVPLAGAWSAARRRSCSLKTLRATTQPALSYVPTPFSVPVEWTRAERKSKERASIKRVASSLYEHAWRRGTTSSRWLLLASLCSLVAAKLLTVSVPFVLQRCLDALVGNDRKAAIRATATYCGLKVGVSLAAEMRSLCYAHASQQATRAYALALFEKMHNLGASFHADHPTGLLSVAFSRGARGFSTLLFQILFSVFPTALELGLSATVLARRFGAALGMATLATFSAYAAFTAFVVSRRVALRQRLIELDNAKSAYLVDSLACEETVKLFDNTRVESARLDDFLGRMVKTFTTSARVSCYLNLGQTAIFSAGLAVCLLKVATPNLAGVGKALSIGELVAVNAMLLQLAQPMNFLGYTVSEIRQSLVDVRLTEEILARPDDSPTTLTRSVESLPDAAPSVVFEGVTKRHGDTTMALRNVSFTCPAGGVTVLVGGSGCGKSSALRLISRLDEPTEGTVGLGYADQMIDTAQVPLRELRAVSSCVPQDVRLFDESIKWNVLYGKIDAEEAEVASALRLAKLDMTCFASGHDTVVGERAGRISGGERQRVGIARALLRGPRLLIADEPTSAADSKTEQTLIKSLCSASPERTVVIAAHRLSSLAPRADHIVVFDRGVVVQTGNHNDLLKIHDGEYSRLWRASLAMTDWEDEDDAALPIPEVRKQKTVAASSNSTVVAA